jgi:hypothetical protein
MHEVYSPGSFTVAGFYNSWRICEAVRGRRNGRFPPSLALATAEADEPIPRIVEQRVEITGDPTASVDEPK